MDCDFGDHPGVGHDGDVGELVGGMNAWIEGNVVVVSAALPSNAFTVSGNPGVSVTAARW